MTTSSQSTATDVPPRVDTHQGKFVQGSTVLLTALAFLLNLPILVLIATVLMVWAALFPATNPYRWLYQRVVVPSGLLKPRLVEDDPAPHRFAQGIGAAFLLAACFVLFFTQATTLGWILDLIIFVLAGINLTIGFCAGCFIYYQLGRAGILPRVRYEGGFHWRGV
jgi:energy-coupling factor transporter transmembrane protein EcfT